MFESKLPFSFFFFNRLFLIGWMYDLTVVSLKKRQDPSLISVGSQMGVAIEWDNRGGFSSTIRELEASTHGRCVCDLIWCLSSSSTTWSLGSNSDQQKMTPGILPAVSLQDPSAIDVAWSYCLTIGIYGDVVGYPTWLQVQKGKSVIFMPDPSKHLPVPCTCGRYARAASQKALGAELSLRSKLILITCFAYRQTPKFRCSCVITLQKFPEVKVLSEK